MQGASCTTAMFLVSVSLNGLLIIVLITVYPFLMLVPSAAEMRYRTKHHYQPTCGIASRKLSKGWETRFQLGIELNP